MTWYQLWKRIGKQPLHSTKYKDVTIKLKDGEYVTIKNIPTGYTYEITEADTDYTEYYKISKTNTGEVIKDKRKDPCGVGNIEYLL